MGGCGRLTYIGFRVLGLRDIGPKKGNQTEKNMVHEMEVKRLTCLSREW